MRRAGNFSEFEDCRKPEVGITAARTFVEDAKSEQRTFPPARSPVRAAVKRSQPRSTRRGIRSQPRMEGKRPSNALPSASVFLMLLQRRCARFIAKTFVAASKRIGPGNIPTNARRRPCIASSICRPFPWEKKKESWSSTRSGSKTPIGERANCPSRARIEMRKDASFNAPTAGGSGESRTNSPGIGFRNGCEPCRPKRVTASANSVFATTCIKTAATATNFFRSARLASDSNSFALRRGLALSDLTLWRIEYGPNFRRQRCGCERLF